MTTLLEAAKDVLESLTSNDPYWSDDQIEALRKAVQEAQDVQVYTPMTEHEREDIRQEWLKHNYGTLQVIALAERAVIERLGLRWPE